jgi:hypothetical protein
MIKLSDPALAGFQSAAFHDVLQATLCMDRAREHQCALSFPRVSFFCLGEQICDDRWAAEARVAGAELANYLGVLLFVANDMLPQRQAD